MKAVRTEGDRYAPESTGERARICSQSYPLPPFTVHSRFHFQAPGPLRAPLSNCSVADRRPNRCNHRVFWECSSSKAGHYHRPTQRGREPERWWRELPRSKSEAPALAVPVRCTFLRAPCNTPNAFRCQPHLIWWQTQYHQCAQTALSGTSAYSACEGLSFP